MFKTSGVGVGGGGGSTAAAAGTINSKGAGAAGGGGGPDFLQLQGSAAATVRGKTREEVQKVFVDVLRTVRATRNAYQRQKRKQQHVFVGARSEQASHTICIATLSSLGTMSAGKYRAEHRRSR